jgi:AcrR family transcriptional regulator
MNRDMATPAAVVGDGTPSAVVGDGGPLDLRARQRDDTRRAILHSFNELLDEGNPVTISVPAVAQRAGVSVRTLYRYFANKDALMEAGGRWFDEAARGAVGGDVTNANRQEYLRRLWVDFADNISAVRAQHASAPGRDLRQRRLPAARALVDAALPPTLDGRDRDDVVDLVVAVASSSMFLELVDRMGHDPERAAALVDRLIDLLITDATGAPT